MSAEEPTLSKSARKRANQKARAAAEAEAAEEKPAPAPAPKEKAAPKAKAAQPAPAEPPAQPKAKAKGKAKAEAKPEPAPAPKSEAKAKAKAAAPKAAAPSEAAEPKAKAKPAAKASGKAAAKAKAKPEPEEPVKEKEPEFFVEYDDGKGGSWEVSTGLTKKQQRQKERRDEVQKEQEAIKKAGIGKAGAHQHIPGLAPPEVQLAQAKAKAEPKAAPVTSVAVVTASAAASKEKEPEKAAVVDNNVTVTVKVPEAKIGRIVGPKGANMIMIKEKTGVKTIDLSGDVCTIVGLADGVALAEHAVRQLIDKGYMSLAFDDFAEEGVQVHPSVFPDIIGVKGAVIQVIKKEAKVEVDIPAVPKNSTGPKKYRVGLAGSRASVEKGKEIINSLVMYGHHEITHPGFVHQEMEVEEWRYRFLIGSKGSEMRHIQNNYHVKVNIPREFSANENVVILGEPANVERAVKYIEKVLYEAEQPKGRGAADQATDNWGDEGEEEDWMKPYMYRRR